MSASGEGQRRHTFRRAAGGIPMKEELFNYLRGCVERAASMYPDEVPSTLANIIDRSFVSLAYHNTEEFIPYGSYWSLDTIVKQVWVDHRYGLKSRPHVVVLYGPPGTGKTTWVRHAARYYFVTFFLDGIYLEVTPGDFSSKFAGVPVALLKSLVDTVSTTKFPSVLLIDEADGILMRPREASGGIEIEQQRLLTELKAALSTLLSMNYPLVIAMTTNYKDSIIRADPAIADRVTAWIEVQHPPLSVRMTMTQRLLPPAFRAVWGMGLPYAQGEAFRALRAGAEPPFPNLSATSHPLFRFRLPWVVPVLSFEADYLIGYLLAWGWNPLDKSVLPSLQLDFHAAVALWDDKNPLFAVYARGLMVELEMMRRFNAEKHGIDKSFLRSFYLLKRGVDEFVNLLALSYGRFWESVVLAVKERELGGKLKDEFEWLGTRMAMSLMVHGVPPSLLHHAVSKQASSFEFAKIVNRVMGTASLAANALRQLYLPFLASYYEDPLMRFVDLRHRLGDYNRFVARELVSGELLAPLRALLTDSDPERAWGEAKRLLASIDEELRPFVGAAAIVARLTHRAVHTDDVEQKGVVLYELYKDVDGLVKATVESAKELGIGEWVALLTDPEVFPLGGVVVYEDFDWCVFDSTLFNTTIAAFFTSAHVHSIAAIADGKLRQYMVSVYKALSAEDTEEKNRSSVPG